MANPFYMANYIAMGGDLMTSQDYWRLFLETGAPEMYIMFNSARKMEKNHVPYSSGAGASCFKLQ